MPRSLALKKTDLSQFVVSQHIRLIQAFDTGIPTGTGVKDIAGKHEVIPHHAHPSMSFPLHQQRCRYHYHQGACHCKTSIQEVIARLPSSWSLPLLRRESPCLHRQRADRRPDRPKSSHSAAAQRVPSSIAQ